MKPKVLKKIKTRDEIMNTLTKVDYIGGKTIGILKDDPKRGYVDIPEWLWTLCDRELKLNETPSDNHNYDYNYFDFPEESEERVRVPVIYFMECWVKNVVEKV